MVKKSVGYVKLEWTCPNCGARNPGPQKTCTGCGAPQPDDVEFEQPAEEKIITDEEEVKRAKAGPDVHCGFCGARNPAGTTICTQCGADLSEGTARKSGAVMGAFRDKKAPDVPCPACGAMNPATALKCSKCGASMAPPKAPTVPHKPTQKTGCSPIFAVVGVVVVAIVALLIFLTTRTHDVIGRVESVSWTSSIAIEELGPVTHEDWRDDIPAGASLGNCSQKAHHTQAEPAPGAREVCGTPYTVDQGSGYGEVVQDCEYEVYADWCEYTVDEWYVLDQAASISGNDLNPRWPELDLGSNQRQGSQSQQFTCILNADGKQHEYRTNDPDAFARCEIGSRWILKVNQLGGVNSMEPAR